MKIHEYIVRRLLLLIPVLIGVTVITFTISHVIPGDVARAYCGNKCPPERVAAIREALGLNKPLYEQYWIYVTDLIQGDWGFSLSQNQPVMDGIKQGFPATAELALVSMFIAAPIGILTGVISAVYRDRWPDQLTRFLAIAGVSVPVFWLGLMLQYTFATAQGVCVVNGNPCLPIFGRHPIGFPFPRDTGFHLIDAWIADPIPRQYARGVYETGLGGLLNSPRLDMFLLSLKYLALPAVTLGYATAGVILRMTRSSMLEVMNEDYIRTARAKGLSERKVTYKHALRNALIPTVTVIGLAFGSLLGGAVLTETIFEINGVGRMAVRAIFQLDFAMIMGFTIIVAFIYVLANLIVDLLYAVLDPRVRLG